MATNLDLAEFYGWSYIPAGVFGTWKKGEKDDVISTISFYNSDEAPTAADMVTTKATSRAPEVLNGVGNINKTQVLGGDEFKITGRINDANVGLEPASGTSAICDDDQRLQLQGFNHY